MADFGRLGQVIMYACKLLKVVGVLLLVVAFLYVVMQRFEAYKHCEAKYLEDQMQLVHYRENQQQQQQQPQQQQQQQQQQQVKKNVKTAGKLNIVADLDNNDNDNDNTYHMNQRNGGFDLNHYFLSSAFEVSGLGNLMFQYAALLGIAKHYGMTPVVPSNLTLGRHFHHLSAKVSNVTRPGSSWGKVIANKASAFQPKVLTMPRIDQHLELVGFFQSWKYFENLDTEIKSEFEFPEDVKQSAKEFIEQTKEKYSAALNVSAAVPVSNVIAIGLHVRRGDMSSEKFKDIGYTTVDTRYISRAMEYMARKHKHLVYIACSDDMNWLTESINEIQNGGSQDKIRDGGVHEKIQDGSSHDEIQGGGSPDKIQYGDADNKIQNGGGSRNATTGTGSRPKYNIRFCPGHDDIADLALLTLTDHVITSTGTFSWWAGWLSRGEVVYYKDFPKDDSRLAKMFSADRMDYFCPGWTPL